MAFRSLIFAAAVLLLRPDQVLAADPRIQVVPYAADAVVSLPVTLGYAAVVELGADEEIQNVVVGASAGWQVTANSGADRIIVKPLAGAAHTDMIVVTDVRRYIFMLDPGGASQDLLVLRFTYPEVAAASTTAWKAAYKLKGAKKLFPTAMRDDGQRTVITWADQAALPAVFAIGDGGKEAIVNGRMIGADYVIEGISREYVFRLGDTEAVASRKPLEAGR
jgi:type IV secretion system protein VirB9